MGHWNLAEKRVVKQPVLTNRFFFPHLQPANPKHMESNTTQDAKLKKTSLRSSHFPQYAYPMHF